MFFFLEDSIKCLSVQTVTDEEFQSIRKYYEEIKSCTHDNNIILTTAKGTMVFTFPGFIEFNTMINFVPSLSSICDQTDIDKNGIFSAGDCLLFIFYDEFENCLIKLINNETINSIPIINSTFHKNNC